MTTSGDLADQLAAEAARIDTELAEIDLLVSQARTEAGRHESRRAQSADRLAGLGSSASAREAIDLANQTVTLTRRAALMEAQLEILDGKRKSLTRLKESIADHAERVRALELGDGAGADKGAFSRVDRGRRAAAGDDAAADGEGSGPTLPRAVMAAQEDLRREIARQMHDGPAQSLTNIVLQAEIVERLVGKDTAAAEREVQQLVAMVQSTLEATKTFIFDVRPMVLDDLGLVPTLRRAARDRGQRAGQRVEFESVGVDRRLAPELESGLFRIIDEALGAYLGAQPDSISLHLDWSDDLVAELAASKAPVEVPPPDLPPQADGGKLPPALQAMVEERRRAHTESVERALDEAIVRLPAALWRDVASRAETLGIAAEALDSGGRIRLRLNLDDGVVAVGAGTGSGAGGEGAPG